MRDTILNTIAILAIAAFLGFATFTLVTIGKQSHPSEACKEDEAWIATPDGNYQDAHGVTRACIPLDDLGR